MTTTFLTPTVQNGERKERKSGRNSKRNKKSIILQYKIKWEEKCENKIKKETREANVKCQK